MSPYFYRRSLFGLILGLLAIGSARAQVTYEIVGGATVQPSTADFTIDLQVVSADTVIRIYDAGQLGGQLPTASAGRITIAGSIAPGTSPVVNVFLASQFESVNFSSPNLQADWGLLNLSTLTVTDPELRARTRAIVSLAGSLTGDSANPTAPHLHVGQVFRLHARQDILGNVVATADDNAFGDSLRSIEHVRAGNLISGNISAAGAVTSSIRDVRVVTSGTIIPGIRGNITATNGEIASVWATGQFGTQFTGGWHRFTVR